MAENDEERTRRRLDQLRSWRKPRGLEGPRDVVDREMREVARGAGLEGVLEAINVAIPGMEFEIVGIVRNKLQIKAPDASAGFLLDDALRSGLQRQLLSLSKGAFSRVVVKP